MKSKLPHILVLCLLPGIALSQGVPTNDSGLTARDIVETGDREADLALQADKLAVRELIAEIEREQLETLRRILDAQTSFGGQGLPAMVSGLESGSGDPDRSVAAVYGTGDIDPNRGGAQMFALSAVDVALWDLVGQRPQITGRRHDIFGESAVAVNADAYGIGTQMMFPGAAAVGEGAKEAFHFGQGIGLFLFRLLAVVVVEKDELGT